MREREKEERERERGEKEVREGKQSEEMDEKVVEV
jgi:hypothetical protein